MTQQMKDVATMTYREATAELEQVVRALESNQLELEESLELYKRGVELLASLRARLADAEQQVSALMGQIEVDTDERDTTLS
ncbi:MAG: exodeoxyribonuclease VII small subunit [Coriobacteriaceae bacterium]|nr:exodeoxyribonuclease VII small subunit [Coriobacteriaceae bacterium]MDD7112176.1 exodeoxyribonuclease VII small subunit [Coriobacteriaceae bacterium]MDY5809368.1 exodeoxyribonuclease VII small subunit [Coriobacteriales bacterium]